MSNYIYDKIYAVKILLHFKIPGIFVHYDRSSKLKKNLKKLFNCR